MARVSRPITGCSKANCSLILYFAAHSPDNSFMGFAVPRKSQENEMHLKRPNTREAALVYGKDPEFWKVSLTDYTCGSIA